MTDVNEYEINERLSDLIEHLGITPYEFSKSIGNDRPDGLYKILKKESKPSPKTLNKIKEKYPNHFAWLLTGQGGIFSDDNKPAPQNNQIPNTNPKAVPYYDVDFTAGFLEVTNNQQTQPDHYVTHPFFKGCDFIVRASGQSMAKLINHGDAIGLTKVEDWQDFLPMGEIYAIVTRNGFRMIKVVTKGIDDDHFTLISKPTDSKRDEFPPQQIRKDMILSVFKVQASSHLF